MKKGKKLLFWLSALLLTAVISIPLLGNISGETLVQASGRQGKKGAQATELTVHYLDVGQGDCILVECDGEAMLIDAGDNDQGTKIQNYLMKQGVKELKYAVGTHPDADHIGGLDVILYKFDCGKVMMPDMAKDTAAYRDVVDTMKQRGYQNSVPEPGDSFLFMGDAEETAEADLIESGRDMAADVLKVGHHGSHSSSSKEFLEAADPSYAVISCGEDNSYGHPHAETLNNLRAMGVEVFRSDEQGTILAVSDGSKITWNSAPSDSWKAGEASVSGSYIGNKNNGKLHRAGCNSLPMEKNQVLFSTREEAVRAGYDDPCKRCNP